MSLDPLFCQLSGYSKMGPPVAASTPKKWCKEEEIKYCKTLIVAFI
jgi:hypothetical protein